jgi:dipeptidyl aminopeptidase/acylaminoacyl peptidase
MDTDGANVRQLTLATGRTVPQWSPDGQRISFSSDRDGDSEIYVMNADGSDQRRLPKAPGAMKSPTDPGQLTGAARTGARDTPRQYRYLARGCVPPRLLV